MLTDIDPPPFPVGWKKNLSTYYGRMEREAKAKVVASVWGGADFVQFLTALAVLPRSIWKIRVNSTVSSKPNILSHQKVTFGFVF